MRRLILLTLIFAATLSLSSSDAKSQEWTRFRGPNGTGESEATTIPAKWSDADYDWIAKLPGVGNSSPVLWGDQVFLMSADAATATRYVLCFDAKRGGERWKREFPSTPHHLHKMSSYASCTPAVDAERVYVAWSTPASLTFMALNHNGETVWQKDLGKWYSQHGFGASPVLFEGKVILSNSQEPKNGPDVLDITPESFLMAFDCRTGDEVWRAPMKTDNISYSAPSLFQPKNGPVQLVNTSTGSGMYAVDPQTGKEIWSTVVFDKRTVSSPLVKDDLIFGSTGSGGGGSYVTAVRSDGKQADVVYQIKIQAPYVPTVVARDDLLFMISDGGIATCVDLKSGKVHWQKRVGGNFQSSPVRVADKFYSVSVEGEVVVLGAKTQFEELGRTSLGEGTRATPAIAGGRMYFRTFSKLMSIGGKQEERPVATSSTSKN